MIEMKNYSGQTSVPGTETHYRYCNFSQPTSTIQGGKAVPVPVAFPEASGPITFEECNFCNAKPPAGSILIRCNTVLTMTQTDTVGFTVNGQPITDTIEYREVHGRVLDDGTPEYKPQPERIQ